MTCTCIEIVNEKLAERNTKLTQSIVLRDNRMDMTLLVATEVIVKKRGQSALLMQPSYCPFCGAKYEEDAA
jgi:predicted Zn-ribbon and HTH transcriptional regulator